MNFDDTPEEAALRAEVRAWIDANAPRRLEPELKRAGFAFSGIESEDPMAASKAWQKKKAQAGWACLHWPKEYGGRAASPIERVIFGQEEGVYGALSGPFIIGHGMCGPTVMAWASEEQKQQLLPPLASGEEIWCQLFSEPAGGSDLAGSVTRATRDGDSYAISGSKVWTSAADYSDFGFCLARTDWDVPKHRGLTMFVVPLRTAGLEVIPLRLVTGDTGFCQEFFDNVVVPAGDVIGEVNDGWTVASRLLVH